MESLGDLRQESSLSRRDGEADTGGAEGSRESIEAQHAISPGSQQARAGVDLGLRRRTGWRGGTPEGAASVPGGHSLGWHESLRIHGMSKVQILDPPECAPSPNAIDALTLERIKRQHLARDLGTGIPQAGSGGKVAPDQVAPQASHDQRVDLLTMSQALEGSRARPVAFTATQLTQMS